MCCGPPTPADHACASDPQHVDELEAVRRVEHARATGGVCSARADRLWWWIPDDSCRPRRAHGWKGTSTAIFQVRWEVHARVIETAWDWSQESRPRCASPIRPFLRGSPGPRIYAAVGKVRSGAGGPASTAARRPPAIEVNVASNSGVGRRLPPDPAYRRTTPAAL